MSPVRVAVVGLGGISQSVHLPVLQRRWDLFEIAALADLSSARVEAVAARHGLAPRRCFHTVKDLLQARAAGTVAVDAVVLATTGSHAPEVRQLAAAGMPVLAEKPLALNLAEIDALDGADGAPIMVGYMKEHDPATARARAELAGTTLRAVTVEVLHPADAAQLHFARLLPAPHDIDPGTRTTLERRTHQAVDIAVGADLPERLRTLYTNVVLGSLIHDISLLRHLVGGVATVEDAVHWGGSMPGSVEVTGTVRGGARLHVGWHFLPDYPDYRETVTFHHEHGSIELVFAVPYLLNVPTQLTITSRASANDVDGAPGLVRTVHTWNQQEAFENQLVAFHALATRGIRPSSGPPEARADLVVGQRIIAALARREGLGVGGEAAGPR